MVKHATPAGTRSMLDAAKDTLYRGQVDHIIVTGTATGATIDLEDLKELRDALPKVLFGLVLVLISRTSAKYAICRWRHRRDIFPRRWRTFNPLDVSRVKTFMTALE